MIFLNGYLIWSCLYHLFKQGGTYPNHRRPLLIVGYVKYFNVLQDERCQCFSLSTSASPPSQKKNPILKAFQQMFLSNECLNIINPCLMKSIWREVNDKCVTKSHFTCTSLFPFHIWLQLFFILHCTEDSLRLLTLWSLIQRWFYIYWIQMNDLNQ